MGGIFDKIGGFLFGESPSVEERQLNRLLPEQEEALKKALERSLETLDDPSAFQFGVPDLFQSVYDADAFASTLFRELENISPQAFQTVSRLLGGNIPGADPVKRLTQFAAPVLALREAAFPTPIIQAGLLRAIAAEPTSYEEFFQAAVFQPALEDLEEEVLPQVRNRFAPSGFYSDERLRSENRTIEDFLETMAAAREEFAFKSREAAEQRALTAVALAQEQQNAAADVGQVAGSQALQEQANRVSAIQAALAFLPGAAGAANSAAFGAQGARQTQFEQMLQLEMARQQEFQERRNFIRDLLLVSPFDNNIVVDPGRPGLFSEFIKGLGQGVGSSA